MSTGKAEDIKHGEVQIMSAGSGILHSEHNHHPSEICELLQIWVLPKKLSVTPRYEQKKYSLEDLQKGFHLVVSPEGEGDAVSINQSAYFSLHHSLHTSTQIYRPYTQDHLLYVFQISGESLISGTKLLARDAAGFHAQELTFDLAPASQVLVMEVAKD
jgi:redox-sensitive bicupin YhaK (pirin superfamily)